MRWEATSLTNNFYPRPAPVQAADQVWRGDVSPNLMTSGRLATRRDWRSSRETRWRAVILLAG